MQSVKQKKICVLLVSLIINAAVLIAVRIYCNLVKYQVKQKYLLPFHLTYYKLVNVLWIWIVMMNYKKLTLTIVRIIISMT